MEQDRFASNCKLYIIGMICLVLCLGFFFFSLYILSYLIWNLNYNVPAFIWTLLSSFEEDYNYTVSGSKVIVWLIFFVQCVITGIISYFISNHIDNQIYKSEIKTEVSEEEPSQNREIRRQMKESAGFGLKIFALMIFSLLFFFITIFCSINSIARSRRGHGLFNTLEN